MTELREAIERLVAGLPRPDLDAPVRLWVDRCFSIRGSGTVVTGTLAAGRLRVGDELEIASLGRTARVRSLQTLGRPVTEAAAVCRVAVNLRGIERHELGRGEALLAPQRFHRGGVLDVRVHGDPVRSLPAEVMLHLGSAAVPARVRPLGADTARLTLAHPLPLRIGDRGLLRNPGRHHISGGITVLDVAPPPLDRRRAATTRARLLAGLDGTPDERSELRRRGLVRRTDLEGMGVTVTTRPLAGDWLVDPDVLTALRSRLPRLLTEWCRQHPLEPGPPVDVVRQELDLPDRALVHALLAPPLVVRAGRVVRADQQATLPAPVARALDQVRAELAAHPFTAPAADRLARLGLGPRELAAAVRVGSLIQLADGVVLLPASIDQAAAALAALPQPFTVSQARQALDTTRRVAVPLLELLDRRGLTQRLPDDRRQLRRP
jgi:selenocysteine-specific elongation factor